MHKQNSKPYLLRRSATRVLNTRLVGRGLRAVQHAVFSLFHIIGSPGVILVVYELWLDGRGVDALIVEELFDFFSNLHVFGEISASDVGRCDDSVPGQLPDVKFVNGKNTVDFGKKPPLDGVNLDVGRHGLQENQRGVPQQRPDRMEDQHD